MSTLADRVSTYEFACNPVSNTYFIRLRSLSYEKQLMSNVTCSSKVLLEPIIMENWSQTYAFGAGIVRDISRCTRTRIAIDLVQTLVIRRTRK